MLHLGVVDSDEAPVPRCGGTDESDIVTFAKHRVTCDFCRLLMSAENLDGPWVAPEVWDAATTDIGGALPFHKHALNGAGTRLCDMTPERARMYYFTAAEAKEIDCTHCLEIVNSWRPK